jgi:hypothetical protein
MQIYGGFAGLITYSYTPAIYFRLENNYAKGNTTSTDNGNGLGGFLGTFQAMAGITGKLELINNYSTGKPTTTSSYKGGFFGYLVPTGTRNITYTNNFYDRTTSTMTTTVGTATYKTTTEMKTPVTFTNASWSTSIWDLVSNEYPTLKWDFTNVWNQVAGGNPTLKWQ